MDFNIKVAGVIHLLFIRSFLHSLDKCDAPRVRVWVDTQE